ncbi:ribonuclease R [Salidesulfovibrio brasiliensis]|uniref:ribonuclease R n=1 Tax=Salidesulfovibrio brasiliensis TaxID=221711 RepID=UPI0006D2746D|nr:ribonuclease R [Salidesulfovibrio brasiliensis]
MAKRKGKGGRKEPVLTEASVLGVFKQAKKPLPRAEVIRAMGLRKKDKRELKEILKSLVRQGKLIRIRRAYGLPGPMHLITGTLQMQRGGFGFVIPEDVRRKDIFIGRSKLNGAWHGDKVAVAIVRERTTKNHEGRIVRILERGRQTLPVRIFKHMREGEWLAKPTDPLLNFGVWCRNPQGIELSEGDVAICEPGEQMDPTLWEGTITSLLGRETDFEVQEALVKSNHNIRTRFPSDTQDEAGKLPEAPDEAHFKDRTDLRNLPLVTIDGEDARDFDDAVCVERDGSGWTLWVAIADVSHYVRPGSALDREALERGNSYYFPKSVEPMLPERLSNGLCSLRPDENRLCMAVKMHVNQGGKVVGNGEMFRGVMKSRARLTYGRVQRALNGDEGERLGLGDLWPMIQEAEKLAKAMRKHRMERGSIDMDIPEPEIRFGRSGKISSIRPSTRMFAHMLIEEFMVGANEAVARTLRDADLPCMYRVHPPADEEKLRALFRLMSQTDPEVTQPKEVDPQAIAGLLDHVRGTDKEFLVSRLLLRSMKQAGYSPDDEGHFGLASECYCHFTSPIRRYADLIVHRILNHRLGAQADVGLPGIKKLSRIAGLINGCERTGMEAEREIDRRASVLFLMDKVGQTFRGVISGITDYGIRVELPDVMADGMVRLSSLDDDYYTYWRNRECLVGERTGRAFTIGQSLSVTLDDVSLGSLELTLSVSDVEADAVDYKDLL